MIDNQSKKSSDFNFIIPRFSFFQYFQPYIPSIVAEVNIHGSFCHFTSAIIALSSFILVSHIFCWKYSMKNVLRLLGTSLLTNGIGKQSVIFPSLSTERYVYTLSNHHNQLLLNVHRINKSKRRIFFATIINDF